MFQGIPQVCSDNGHVRGKQGARRLILDLLRLTQVRGSFISKVNSELGLELDLDVICG